MKNRLKPYEEYRDTEDLICLESVPKHWKIIQNSLLFREVVDTNNEDLELLSILMDKGIVKQSSTGRKIRMSQDNSMYKKICVGDIGYNLMNAFMGALGASKYKGIISPAYAVCRPKIQLNSWYYHYLFRTPLYKTLFDINSYGIMYERNRLYFDRFKQIKALLPPIEEQDQIVRYLDSKLSKINKFIKDKKKLIELLKEQKQAVINQAVTKGLDPNAKMKPSGIEWIGDIPDGWEVRKFKYCFNTTSGMSITKAELVEKGIDCIGYGDIHSKYGFELDLTKYELKKAPIEHVKDRQSALAKENDFIFCDTSEDLEGSGNNTYVSMLAGRQLVAGSHTILAQPKEKFESRYLAYLFSTRQWKVQIQKAVNGVKVYSITQRILNDTSLILPSNKEQITIIEYLDKETSSIDKVIKDTNKEIDLMTEYRTSIISHVVTGKVDVRHIEVEDSIEDIEEFEALENKNIEE
jgi:type I restriction enzyme S subunit